MVTPVPVARVSAVQGQAHAKGEDGALRPLRAGDFVYEGEIVITGAASSVELAAMDGQPFRLGANEGLMMDAEVAAQIAPDAADSAIRVSGDEFNRIVAALRQGQSLDDLLEETAAGAAPGEAGGGPTFVRLLRISEGVDPLNFEFAASRRGEVDDPINGGLGAAGAPTLDVADGNGVDAGQATVYERGLLSPGDTSESASGTITVRAPDGLDSLSVGGTAFTGGQLAALTTAPQSVDTGIGTLTLTGYDPATGALAYTYTLNGAQDQPGLEQSTDSISLVLTGPGGTAQGTLNVTIVDSVPAASDDAANIGEDAASNTVSGSVLDNDEVGADANAAPVTPATVTLQYGTLVLNADGSYTYTLDNANPAVNALKTGQTLSDSYVYTLTDGDGDITTATLTITIDGHTDGEPSIAPADGNGAAAGQATVYEQGLTSEADTRETVDGTITVSAADGLLRITIGTTVLTPGQLDALSPASPQTIDTGLGLLTLTGYDPASGALAYTYTLKAPVDQPGAEDSLDNIPLSVTDAANVTTTGTLAIQIVDSAPEANNDTDAVTEDTATVVVGNVVTAGPGADALGADATEVTGVAAGTPASAAGSVGGGIAGIYGTLVLNADGSYTYTLDNGDPAVQALAKGQQVSDTFTYTLTDADGDASTATLTVTVTGTNDAPDITVGMGDRDHADLTETNAGLTASGTLSIYDVDTLDTVDAAKTDAITVGGTYTGPRPDNAALLAMLSVTGGEPSTTAQGNPNGIAWSFDSGSQAFDFIPEGETLTLAYTIRATDSHGATDDQVVTITITGTNDGIQLVDDVKMIAENANAADRSGNVLSNDVLDPDHGQETRVTGFSLDANGDGTAEDYAPGEIVTVTSASGGTLGVFTMASDGSYSFTPHDANYSGPVPVITYTAASSTDSGTATLTITVTPVADAPGVTRDAATVEVFEDYRVVLGLNAPTVSDATDQNGAMTGDNPERLSLITLSGIPNGATLIYGNNEYTSTGGSITIRLSDATNLLANPGTATLTMTTTQFESLRVLPVADSAKNFTVTMSVTEYEVDASGAQLPGVPGATTSTEVYVDVQAVTDKPDLKIDGSDASSEAPYSATISEDTALDLKALLSAEFSDLDGSEHRAIIISNPAGNATIYVNGVAVAGGASHTIAWDAAGNDLETSQSGFPPLSIKGGPDFSGDLNGITVTLSVKDTDSDSTVDTLTLEDSVTLDLHVEPAAGDVAVPDVSTPEDIAVKFLQGVVVSDTDGSETLDGIVVNGIPDGWVLEDGGGNTLAVIGGSYTVPDGDIASGAYKNYTLTPPGNSSQDATLTLDVTSTDTKVVNGTTVTDTITVSKTQTVAVTPVPEKVGGDSNHDNAPDLTINDDFEYTTHAAEDTWFDLNSDGFDLKAGWSNQDADGSEKTYALLTPMLSGGSAIGSQFSYTLNGATHVLTYTGTPVRVPMEALDTLQFKAAADESGTFEIKVQALTIDTDPDTGAAVEAISGEATLTNLVVDPVADPVTLAVDAPPTALEDTAIPLMIRPTSADPSETFRVTLSGIPDGAVIHYNGTELIVSGGSVTIDDFDSALPLTLTPPANSNADFTLNVSAVSVDTSGGVTDISGSASLPLPIDVRGVADPVTLDVRNASTTEAALDAGGHRIALSDIVASAVPADADGSETVNLVITGLPNGFSIEGLAFMGGTGNERVWSGSLAAVQAARLVVLDDNYSGTIDFSVRAVSTENDGDSLSGAAQAVAVTVTPSPEATLATQTTALEDTLTKVDFSLVHQHGDNDETLASVWIKADSLDGQPFTLYLGNTPLASALTPDAGGWYVLSAAQAANVYVQGAANSDADGSFTLRYAVSDPSNDGTLPAVTQQFDATYAIKVAAVTDATVSSNDYAAPGSPITSRAPIDVTVTVAQASDADGQDTDGSEKLLYYVIDGVPPGVVVAGAVYIGDTASGNTGRWILHAPDGTAFDTAALDRTIRFELVGTSEQISNLNTTVSITAYSQDTDAGGAETAKASSTTSWTLQTGDIDDIGGGTLPAKIEQWETTDAGMVEDTPRALADLVDARISGDSPFSITLTDLPPGSVVSGPGVISTVIDGREVWTVSASGGDNDLQNLLASITVTPPADWNDNQGDFSFTATLTTYNHAGQHEAATATIEPAVAPVSDPAVVVSSDADVAEDHAATITLDLSNAKDGAHAHIVDGTLYFRLDESGMEQAGGTLSLDGTVLAKASVSGVAGVPDGEYYVIDGVDTGSRLAFSYVPAADASGTVAYEALVLSQEDGAANVVVSGGGGSFAVTPVNDGVTVTVEPVTGAEDQAIPLNITIVSQDASETIASIVLRNVPNGFLVMVGNDAASAALASDLGSGNWGLSTDGVMPDYVALVPPADWSGTLGDLRVGVWSGDTGLEPREDTAVAAVTVNGVADGIVFTPTLSFGHEGDIVALNLNSVMKDQDGSEIATLTIKGLGEHAAFYAGASLLGAAYDEGSDTYTLSGLTPAQVNTLGVVQGGGDYHLTVTGYTTDSPGDSISSLSTVDMDLKLSDLLATSGDDVLLYDGKPLDGLGGTDTVQLRLGENLDFSSAVGLSNVERLDLMPSGQDHSLSNLSLQDVLDMAGSGKTLTILGDAGDSVGLKNGAGDDQWVLSGSDNSDGHVFDVYTNAYDTAVKVLIEHQVQQHID